MSTAESTFPAVIPSPERLPPEVTSTLTALWLSIASGILALGALWPMALIASADMFPDVPPSDLANLGWILLASVAGFIVVFGLFVTWRVARRSRFGLRTLQLSLLVGLIGGAALLVGLFVLILQGKDPHPLGPTPILSGVILILTALLPICFGILALSYSGTSAVEEFLKAPDTLEESLGGVVETPAAEGGEVVVTEAAPEASGVADATSQVTVQVRGRETMLAPTEGEGRATMLAPTSGEGQSTMLVPHHGTEQAPIQPDELDRMFAPEGGGEAPSGETGEAGPSAMEAQYSESIFDEDDPSRRGPGASGISQSGILREASRLSTGESSIFTEINPLVQGSDILSGIRKEPSDTGLSFLKRGQAQEKQQAEDTGSDSPGDQGETKPPKE